MFSYMRAECYKVLHRKYTYWLLLVILALESLLIGGWVFTNSNGNGIDFYSGVGVFIMMLSVGLYATLITGDLVFSDQYKFNTLKNEVSYGLPRARIYLGKLLVSCLVACVMCAIIVIFYVGGCAIFLKNIKHPELDTQILPLLGFSLLTALPLWLGAQALVVFLFFLIRSNTVASFVMVGIISGLAQIFQLLGALVNPFFYHLYNLMLTPPFDQFSPTIDWAFCGRAWLLGLGWFAATTAVGLYFFRKKEIV